MKIYTRTGDDGTTGLIGGRRVPKNDPHIECCGSIDELNAALGLVAVDAEPTLAGYIHQIQSDLFNMGSHLAVADSRAAEMILPPLLDEILARLESQIDAAESRMPQLRNFILPGGTETAARLHVARTICRRAERLLAALALAHPQPPIITAYMNRLSDWLFVMARLSNFMAGISDVIWKK